MSEKNPWPRIAQDFVKSTEDIMLGYQEILKLLVDPVSPGDPPAPSDEGFGPFGEDCDD